MCDNNKEGSSDFLCQEGNRELSSNADSLGPLAWTVQLEGGPRRVNHAAVAVGHRVYTFGGYNSHQRTRFQQTQSHQIDVHCLDTDTLRWTRVPSADCRDARENQIQLENPFPFLRYGHSVVEWQGCCYLWGGRNDVRPPDTYVYRYDPMKNSWTRLQGKTEKSLVGRDGHSAAVLRDRMYVFGGYEDEHFVYSNSLIVFDFLSTTWIEFSISGTLPTPRDFCALVPWSDNKNYDRLFLWGGRGDMTVLFHSNSDTYDSKVYELRITPSSISSTGIGSGQWIELADMKPIEMDNQEWLAQQMQSEPVAPPPRRSLVLFVWRQQIIMGFGFNSSLNDGAGRHFNDLWRWDWPTCTFKRLWPALCGVRQGPPSVRRRVAAVPIGNRVFFFGGTLPVGELPVGQEAPLLDENALDEEVGAESNVEVGMTELADLHILEAHVSLRTLCMLQVLRYNIPHNDLPAVLRQDLMHLSANNCLMDDVNNANC